MTFTTQDSIPISRAKANLNRLADDVARTGIPKMLTRDGKGFVALVAAVDYDELQRWRLTEHQNPIRQLVEAMRDERLP